MRRRGSSNNDETPEEAAQRIRNRGKSAAKAAQARGEATGDGNTRANRILKQAEENASRIEEEGDNS